MSVQEVQLHGTAARLCQRVTVLALRHAFARLGLFLRAWLPWLFEAVLELYVQCMAAGGQQYEVPSRTLTSLIKEHNFGTVQLLKVDVEGAEVQVNLPDHTYHRLNRACSHMRVHAHERYVLKQQLPHDVACCFFLEQHEYASHYCFPEQQQLLFCGCRSMCV
jgi:Methyltransferase FkbM domain